MNRMKFMEFTFMENPEVFQIKSVRDPIYTVTDDNEYDYSGLGPMCRIFTGSGTFRGDYAYEDFNTLQVLMAVGRPGELVHPIWGTMICYLTELEMTNEPLDMCVSYKFTFREADETGSIPPLPEGYWDHL